MNTQLSLARLTLRNLESRLLYAIQTEADLIDEVGQVDCDADVYKGKFESCATMMKPGKQVSVREDTRLQCLTVDYNKTIENYVTRQGDERFKDGGSAGMRLNNYSRL